ncbi:hypothetical protein [Rhodoligotrophos defluvii]|uniref:hypothetical protein n=1 Tax=Rhodoligotrophos defluvii TaxID=2561934 RepID=UPI001485975B|nr:hypothetical protein [Rhodoligotrophos defluvii]
MPLEPGHGQQAPDDDESDPAIRWGKRLGRALGLILLVYLVWHLYSTYLAA